MPKHGPTFATSKRSKRISKSLFPAFLLCGLALPVLKAEVSLPSLIGDNMVLQQKSHATLWGTADPHEKITVKIAGTVQTGVAGADGHWALKLPTVKTGGPYDMTVSGRNTITVHNVLVGDVWVCGGQSNMEWRVSAAKDAQAEIAAANYPKVRMFTVTKKISDAREFTCQGHWDVCDPSTVANFSAVGYFFGRDLYKAIKIPVGLINASSGATSVEDWLPPDAAEHDTNLKTAVVEQSGDLAMKEEEYKRRYADWVTASEAAKAANQTPPPEPPAPKLASQPQKSSTAFNGMISPLLPYSIKGVIWYQGESNTRNARIYRKLFPALITGWRQSWGEGDFPFLYVQLPGYLLQKSFPTDSAWAELREAQAMALKLPKTAMAVTIDLGEAHSLHPANKQDVGRRLANAALANVYAEDVVASGPVLLSSKADGGSIVLTFKGGAGGLAAKPDELGEQTLHGFAIAGDDKKFEWAEARIEGDKVIVHSSKVAKPVAVRYAWADNPDCNLINKAGLPASPFRTDDW